MKFITVYQNTYHMIINMKTILEPEFDGRTQDHLIVEQAFWRIQHWIILKLSDHNLKFKSQ